MLRIQLAWGKYKVRFTIAQSPKTGVRVQNGKKNSRAVFSGDRSPFSTIETPLQCKERPCNMATGNSDPNHMGKKAKGANTCATKLTCITTRSPSSMTALQRHTNSSPLRSLGVNNFANTPDRRVCTRKNACSDSMAKSPKTTIDKSPPNASPTTSKSAAPVKNRKTHLEFNHD